MEGIGVGVDLANRCFRGGLRGVVPQGRYSGNGDCTGKRGSGGIRGCAGTGIGRGWWGSGWRRGISAPVVQVFGSICTGEQDGGWGGVCGSMPKVRGGGAVSDRAWGDECAGV